MATLQAHFVYVGNLVDRRIIVDFEILSFQGQRSEKKETGDSSRNVHQTIQMNKKSIRLCIFVGFVMIIGYLLRFSIFKDLHEKYIYIFFLFWGFPRDLIHDHVFYMPNSFLFTTSHQYHSSKTNADTNSSPFYFVHKIAQNLFIYSLWHFRMTVVKKYLLIYDSCNLLYTFIFLLKLS